MLVTHQSICHDLVHFEPRSIYVLPPAQAPLGYQEEEEEEEEEQQQQRQQQQEEEEEK